MRYLNPVRAGLDAVSSLGDGSIINVRWFQAYPSNPTFEIAYNIYYSTCKETVFSEGPKYCSIDGSLEANIIGLTPGQLYFFSVRPIEYNPSQFNLETYLPVAYDNLRIYPTSVLREDITATDLLIPLLDTDGFPSTGIIQVGVELIQYTGIDSINHDLIVPAAGGGAQPVTIVLQDGYEYLPLPNNIGQGELVGLTAIPNSGAITETWTIRCIFNQPDGYTAPKFIAIGSISGQRYDGYGNPIIWSADGYTVSNGILSFAITQTSPTFVQGDGFSIKIAAADPGSPGGRGYDHTTATMHTTSGFDGYETWSPVVSLHVIGESNIYDRIFMCQSRFEYPNFPFTSTDGYHQVLKDILNTDLSFSDAQNVNFPTYDYAGYHRTDPVQLLNGTCVGSYIGGEMGCIDAYGNINILRGLSLQDQNNQRQEVLLTVTGRPAVLIKRVHTGITCACYLASSEYQDDRCPLCFASGTLINTQNGFTPIEQIKIGDMVLGSDGNYHKVLNNFKNKYTGKLQSITTTTTINPIICTPDHPFLTLGGSHKNPQGCGPNSNCKEFIKRGDGNKSRNGIKKLPSGRWHARVQAKGHKRKILGTFDTKKEAQIAIDNYLNEHQISGHQIIWKNAKDLNNKSWLVNKWFKHIIDIEKVTIPKRFQKNTKLGSQRNGNIEFYVDEEFLWIVGMYIAEGSNSKRTIQFSLHKDEILFQNKIINYFEKNGFSTATRNSSDNGIVIEIYSTSLAQWFPNWLGHLCFNKKIPNEFMHLPNNKLLALIQGIFDGDAGKRDQDLVQTSEILALQVVEILHKLGKQPNTRKIINKILTLKGNERKVAYGVSKELETFKHKNRKGHWQFNENLLTKIKKIDQIDYDGYVYNLEVDGDHTYVVQNIVVHNCYGTKFVFGYEQYFNPRRSDGRLLVRTSPADDGVKMQEAGLESELNLELWTLTVPTIHQRDIIVLFDVEDNEEFRYEVGTVTRNNTIIGMEGGQKFRGIRIRKTDPAYQIRVFRNTAMFPSKLNTTINGVSGAIVPHSHEIVINENTTSLMQINQTTAVSQGHNHPIINGQVMEVLGHTHNIILP